jgi:hypothetical protein
MNIQNRAGKFTLREDIVNNFPQDVMNIMSNCIITRCEFRWYSGHFEYEAVSPMFSEIESGQMMPEYEVIIAHDEVTFKLKE